MRRGWLARTFAHRDKWADHERRAGVRFSDRRQRRRAARSTPRRTRSRACSRVRARHRRAGARCRSPSARGSARRSSRRSWPSATRSRDEITLQMGRPIAHSPGELRGFEERARAMIAIAPEALADVRPEPKPGFTRFVRREPLGVVLTIAPWNYPLLTAVNSIVPALLAGNAVILRHSAQTPLCAERFRDAFAAASLPDGVFSVLHCDHAATERLIASPGDRLRGVHGLGRRGPRGRARGARSASSARTSSSAARTPPTCGPTPISASRWPSSSTARSSTRVSRAAASSGSTCTRDVYEPFVEQYAALVRGYVLGDPRDPATTLGPVVRTRGGRSRARADRRGARARRARADRRARVRARRARHALPRAAGARRRRSRHARDDRGELRAGGRDRARGGRRRGGRADERQRVRADRVGLDRRRARRRSRSARASRPARSS